ncbi:MAG: wax ester/triacylglycerol synthase family O-acyltransferase [Sphingomonadaceae bacterium]|nr:wax ester/triacylglycerol synthase family O-acyltransferase [Sphingomonadaceae bacterium]
MEQLTGQDASFFYAELPKTPMHVGSLAVYDPSTVKGGKQGFKDILGFIEKRLHLAKTFRRRLVQVPFSMDHPWWIEDRNFDLEFHIRHIRLPEPGDWRQLCIQAARIFSRPLDLTRPPWEFTVVEGLDNIPGIAKGSYAMVTKVHHAAVDGMSGIDLMEVMHTLSPDAPAPDAPDEWKPEKVPNPVELLGKSYFNAITNPLKQLEVAARAAPGLAKAIKGIAVKDFKVGPEMLAPRTRFNRVISTARVVEGRSLPLADIKAIRALAPGSKVNDVFLAIVGGAMRKYLLAKEELPAKSLTAMAPISVRSNNEKGDMGNQVAAMIAQIGTHIEDPAERLAFVHSKTTNSKAMTDAIGARNMTEVSKVSPALYMSLGARLYTRLGLANRVGPPFSTVVTNVPGPPVPIYSSGARLQSMIGLVCLTDGMGLAHVVQSYCDEASISFTACRELLPDPEFYAQCIEDSFAELRDAAKAASGQPEAKAQKRKPAAPVKGRPAAPATRAKKAAPAKTGATGKPPADKSTKTTKPAPKKRVAKKPASKTGSTGKAAPRKTAKSRKGTTSK